MNRMTIVSAAALALAACSGGTEEPTEPTATSTAAETAAATGTDPEAETPKQSSAGCSDAETTIFACTVKGGKTVSVCSTGGKSATYRFGGNEPEIELQGGSWARVGYSGGGELQIAFDNDDTRYVVFSRTVRTNFEPGEPNEPAMSDGVIVLRGGKYAGMQLCSATVGNADDGEASEAALQQLPRADDLFTDETSRADGE